VVVLKGMGNKKFMLILGSSTTQQRRIFTYCLFIDEVINMVVKHEMYTFLDAFLGCHQILIAPKD